MTTRPPRSPPIDLAHPERDDEVVERLSAEQIREIISESPVFDGAPAEALAALARLAQQRLVHKDRFLFITGDPCTEFHIVAEGCAHLSRVGPDGRQRILHRAGPGEMVGCVAFFDGESYPATFVADTDCVVLSFPRDKVLELLATYPALHLSVAQALARRLRYMEVAVGQMSFEDTSVRLWEFLVQLSTPVGRSCFPRVIDPLPTREHIAGAIGTVREVVSRRLSQFVEAGLIGIEGRKLTMYKRLDGQWREHRAGGR